MSKPIATPDTTSAGRFIRGQQWIKTPPAWYAALSWTLATKVFLLIIGWFAWAILPTSHLGHKTYPVYLNIWGRWDSAWFVRVSEQGYVHGWPQNPAFYPLYPGLIHLGHLLIPSLSPYTIAAAISWGFSFLVFYWLIRLAQLDYPPEASYVTARMLALFPTAFFLSVGYSEAPFIALVIGAFYLARKGQWLWVALLSFLAALTRNEGGLLVLPLLWEYWAQFRTRIRWRALLGVVGGPIGLLAYMGYLQAVGLGAYAPLRAEKYWGRKTVPPWQGLHLAVSTLVHHPHLSTPLFTYTAIDLTSALLVLGATVWMIHRHYRWSYVIWSALIVLIPLSSVVNPPFYSPILSMSRLILPAFPLFFILAQWSQASSFWRGVTSYVFPGAQALFFTFWILYYWIA